MEQGNKKTETADIPPIGFEESRWLHLAMLYTRYMDEELDLWRSLFILYSRIQVIHASMSKHRPGVGRKGMHPSLSPQDFTANRVVIFKRVSALRFFAAGLSRAGRDSSQTWHNKRTNHHHGTMTALRHCINITLNTTYYWYMSHIGP